MGAWCRNSALAQGLSVSLLQFKPCHSRRVCFQNAAGGAKENSYLTITYVLCFSEMPQKCWPLVRERQRQAGTSGGNSAAVSSPPQTAADRRQPGAGQGCAAKRRWKQLGDHLCLSTCRGMRAEALNWETELLPTILEAPRSGRRLTLRRLFNPSDPASLHRS